MKYLSWTVISFAALSTALHSPLQSTKLCSGLGGPLPHGVPQEAPVAIQSSLLVDEISINGKPQALISGIMLDRSSGHANTPIKPISARLHAGISAAELPEETFHALYTGMGGVMMNDSSMYAVPCMSEAELVFTFGGQKITIHPLYLTAVQSYEFADGQTFTVCTSSYQPATHCRDGDIILGDPFLRNVDAIYNYEGSAGIGLEDSIKTSTRIIPLTDAKNASTEFKKTRAKILAALPAEVDVLTINDPVPKPLRGGSWNLRSAGDTAQAQFSTRLPGTYLTVGSSSDSNNDTEAALKKLTTIAPIALTILILILALLVALIVISAHILALLKSQASLSVAAHVTTPLGGAIGDYRD